MSAKGFCSSARPRGRRANRIPIPTLVQGTSIFSSNIPSCLLSLSTLLSQQRGNLQDAINNNLQTSSHFPERQMLRLFKGTCEAVRAMHTYRVSSSSSNSSAPPRPPSRGKSHSPGHDDDDDDHDGMLPHPEGDAEGGYSYGGPSGPSSTRGARGEPRARGDDRDGASVPLVSRERQEDGDVVFDGDEEIQRGEVGTGELVPYAHRDLKPG